MRLPRFAYLPASTTAEAAQLLAEHPGAQLVSGGTDLLPKMKRRQLEPKVLIGLRGVSELHGIHVNGGATIGAGTRLHELSSAPDIVHRFPALARAASLVASPQIRNAGTVGGNLCVDTRCNYYDLSYDRRCAHDFCMKAGSDVCRLAPGGDRCWAVSSTDLAPVAHVLGGSVRLVSTRGERTLPIAQLYTMDDGIDYLQKQPDEVLTAIMLPPTDGLRATYVKFRRRGAIDFPLLGVAAAVRTDAAGTCTEARLVLGAVATAPLPVPRAGELLVGAALTEEAITAAAETAMSATKPMDALDLPLAYRRRMVKIHVARALRELVPESGRP
ncbi:MAG TPA: FAD binding domain-containing protein [Solirubrobacteraceae bacterium]|nr:FAD binding domain-containing protein [Solirubrobacteraceae bacterium]